MSNGTTTWNYTYNADGLRTSRTNGSTTYNYTYNGDKLTYMTVDGYLHLYFAYDASGVPMSVTYNGTTYYYVTNVQGDVIGILDSAGTQVATYAYDAWGNPLAGTDSQTSEIGTLNPLRYRSYVYDSDTKLYYLQSRYYNPEMGRFINGDNYPSTGQGLLGNNMFAYCNNNPIINKDTAGTALETVWDVISLGASIAEVALNPTDVWAWAGLIGDIADVCIPFVGGIGEAVDATKVVTGVVKNADEVVDAADAIKAGQNVGKNIGWHVGENVSNLTKAGNTPSWSTVRQRFWKNEAFYHPDLYPNDLGRMKKGLAPIGSDGFPMELHHPRGRKGYNYYVFEPKTRTAHRWIHYGD